MPGPQAAETFSVVLLQLYELPRGFCLDNLQGFLKTWNVRNLRGSLPGQDYHLGDLLDFLSPNLQSCSLTLSLKDFHQGNFLANPVFLLTHLPST